MWIETNHVNLSAKGSRGAVTAGKRNVMNTKDLHFLPAAQLGPKEGTCLWLLCPTSILPWKALRLLESMSSMGSWCKRISSLEKIKLCLHLWLFWAVLVQRHQPAHSVRMKEFISKVQDFPANPEREGTALDSRRKTPELARASLWLWAIVTPNTKGGKPLCLRKP